MSPAGRPPPSPGSNRNDAALQIFLAELRTWGERVNLVGSIDDAALQVHIDDSLAASPEIPVGARVVDLGSGAGFPGVPIQIARPDLRLTLVEIRERRFHFLRHVARRLGLQCEIVRRRIEAETARLFDIALLRAVAPPERSAALARPWLLPEGEIWLWTREPSAWASQDVAGEIPLPLGRGRILRVRAAAVPRGTH